MVELTDEDQGTRIWEFDPDGESASFVLMGGGFTTTYSYEVTAPDASRASSPIRSASLSCVRL